MAVELPLVVAGLSAAASLASAFFARRSSLASRASAETAALKAQADYNLSLLKVDLPAVLRVDKVEYGWTRQGRDDVPEEGVAIRHAEECTMSLEVHVAGRIEVGDADVLLTFRDHPESGRTTWSPLVNESTFTVDGTSGVHRLACAAGRNLDLQWVDRRSVSDWARIYAVHKGAPVESTRAERLPRLTPVQVSELLADKLRGVVLPVDSYRAMRVRRSGFQVIAETRVRERVATVWEAEVTRPPIRPETLTDDRTWLWGLERGSAQHVDDDVLFYRVSLDDSHSLLKRPRTLHVPGRL